MIRPDQIESEVKAIMALFDEVYNVFGLSYHIVLSTRPEKDYIGTVEFWDKSEAALAQACKDSGTYLRNQPGRRRLLWPEARLQTQGFDGPDLAMRHDSARCEPAAPLRLLLHR
jgi:threonyl-tRNA synthetase